MGVVGPLGSGGCRPGAGAPRRPLCSTKCGGWSLDIGSQTPADGEDSSTLDSTISQAGTSSMGVLSQSPPPISVTPAHQVRGSKDWAPVLSLPSPGSLCAGQCLLVASHCHRQLVSPTSGSLPNAACAPEPARPGAPSVRGHWLPSAKRRSQASILLLQEALGGAVSFCTCVGLQGCPPHTEGHPHSTLTPLCPGQPWKP